MPDKSTAVALDDLHDHRVPKISKVYGDLYTPTTGYGWCDCCTHAFTEEEMAEVVHAGPFDLVVHVTCRDEYETSAERRLFQFLKWYRKRGKPNDVLNALIADVHSAAGAVDMAHWRKEEAMHHVSGQAMATMKASVAMGGMDVATLSGWAGKLDKWLPSLYHVDIQKHDDVRLLLGAISDELARLGEWK
jgi:hypothetical protein